VVIYPVYQAEGEKTSPQKITANAAQGVRAAIDMLRQSHPQLIDEGKTLYWGFSMGASISTNFAVRHTELGIPAPRAVVLVAPGDAYHVVHGADSVPTVARLESVPPTLPVFLVSGAADTSIGVPTARAWAARLCHLPRSHRTLLMLPSHSDGGQQISSAHGSPGAPDSRFDFPDATANVPKRITGRCLITLRVARIRLRCSHPNRWRIASSVSGRRVNRMQRLSKRKCATEYCATDWIVARTSKPWTNLTLTGKVKTLRIYFSDT
jgi:hypothetical protein